MNVRVAVIASVASQRDCPIDDKNRRSGTKQSVVPDVIPAKTDCFAVALRALLAMTVFCTTLYAKPPDTGPIPPLVFTPPTPERVALKNGAVVYLLEDHELPLVSLRLQFKVDPALWDPSKVGTSAVLSEVWRSGGTKNRTPDQLNEELERMASSVEVSVGPEEAEVSMNSLTRNVPATLEIFADVLMNPAFGNSQFTLAKGKLLENVRRKNDDPGNIARRAFRDVLYGPTHLYARDATEPSVGAIRRADLGALHKKILYPDTAVIAVSGDFKKEEMVALLDSLFNDWSASGKGIAPYDYAPQNAPEGNLFMVSKNINQSRVYIGQLGFTRHNPDHFAMTIADFILGGGSTSRLFTEVRSKRGLAYSVGSFFSVYTGAGIVAVGGQTKTESTVEFIEALKTEIQKMKHAPPTLKEMDLAKESFTNSFVFLYDSKEKIVSQRAGLEFHGYPKDYLETYLSKINQVSTGDVQRVIGKYFSNDQLKTMVVGDAKELRGKLPGVVEIPLEKLD